MSLGVHRILVVVLFLVLLLARTRLGRIASSFSLGLSQVQFQFMGVVGNLSGPRGLNNSEIVQAFGHLQQL